MSEDATQYKVSRGDAEAQSDGKTNSAHHILAELAKQNGANETSLIDLRERGEGWQASLWWSANDAEGYTTRSQMFNLTHCAGKGATDLAAVDDLAAKIPEHRERIRGELPEYIKRLRKLAKEI